MTDRVCHIHTQVHGCVCMCVTYESPCRSPGWSHVASVTHQMILSVLLFDDSGQRTQMEVRWSGLETKSACCHVGNMSLRKPHFPFYPSCIMTSMPSLCSLSSHALLSPLDICGLSVLHMVRTHLRLHSFLATTGNKQSMFIRHWKKCVLVCAFFGAILQCLTTKTTDPVLAPFGCSKLASICGDVLRTENISKHVPTHLS